MTDVSTTCSEVIFRVKEEQLSVDDVIKSGPLNVIGQFSHDVIGCKTRVKLVNSDRSTVIRLRSKLNVGIGIP